jgi:spore coat protein SA
MKKIAIILPWKLPVPSILGGAIETIAQLTIDQNEIQKKLHIAVFSSFDRAAKKRSTQYRHAQFVWIHMGRMFDALNFFFRGLRRLGFSRLDRLDGQILKWHVRGRSFDKVIVYGGSDQLLALAKVVPSEKLIFYVHANLFNEPTEVSRATGRAAQQYWMISEYIKSHLIMNAHIDPSKCLILKNPIDFKIFNSVCGTPRPDDLVKKYGIEPSDFVLLFVGRIVDYKGIKHLLLALESLPEEMAFKLLVVGSFGSGFGRADEDNVFRRELMALAERMSGKIIFTGFVHNTALPRYHALADVVIMPSLYEEPAGMVAMEAMASGRPVITTDAGGIPEYVTPECAIIIKRGDYFVPDLAAAIRTLASDPEKRRRMSAAGVADAQKFSPEVYYEKYVALVKGGS